MGHAWGSGLVLMIWSKIWINLKKNKLNFKLLKCILKFSKRGRGRGRNRNSKIFRV